MTNPDARKGAELRQKIKDALIEENIEVWLGEDEGLERLRSKYRADAQTNEIRFIECADSVIVIADGVGPFCELGAFSQAFNNQGRADFIVVVDKKHQPDESRKTYLHEGPLHLIKNTMKSHVVYEDFEKADSIRDVIMGRIKSQRFSRKPAD